MSESNDYFTVRKLPIWDFKIATNWPILEISQFSAKISFAQDFPLPRKCKSSGMCTQVSRRFNRHQVPELDVNNSCSTLFEVKLRRLMSNKIPRCCQAKPDELTHYQSSLYLILAYIIHLTATYLLPSPTYLLHVSYTHLTQPTILLV